MQQYIELIKEQLTVTPQHKKYIYKRNQKSFFNLFFFFFFHKQLLIHTMPQLRFRTVKVEKIVKTESTITKKKTQVKKPKTIIQTFKAIDEDIESKYH
jgi:hypothetical protein